MENIEVDDIRSKIEHAFNLNQIFDIFSTFVTAMKNQEKKIQQLEKDLAVANNKYNDLATSVHTIEYNIQGFEIDDDDMELKSGGGRTRPSSHVSNKTPRPFLENRSRTEIRLRKQLSGVGALGVGTEPGLGHHHDDHNHNQNKYETQMNLGPEVRLSDVPPELVFPEISIQPTILEVGSLLGSPNSRQHSRPTSLKPSPRPTIGVEQTTLPHSEEKDKEPNPLDLVSELITLAKENPSYHSSRNVSPRTASAVIYPPPHRDNDQDGMISNIPSHDPLDDHYNHNQYIDPSSSSLESHQHDPPMSPSGTSVSSLTLASHQQAYASNHGSLRASPQQLLSPPDSSRGHQSKEEEKNPSFELIHNELHDIQSTLIPEKIEDDEFDRAMKELATFNFNPSTLIVKISEEEQQQILQYQENKRSHHSHHNSHHHPQAHADLSHEQHSHPINESLSEIKYHSEVDRNESLSSYPSIDLASATNSSRDETEKIPSSVIPSAPPPLVPTTITSQSSASVTTSPTVTKKRRKGLFDPIERKPEDIEAEKKGVGRSKLDPKLTVNHRLLALEDTIRAMSDVINAHHRALDAIPARLKKVTSNDVHTQITRLSHVLTRLETDLHVPSERLSTQESQGITIDMLDEEILNEIVHRVMKLLPSLEKTTSSSSSSGASHSNKSSSHSSHPSSLTDEEVKILVTRMKSNGHFDEFEQIQSSRSEKVTHPPLVPHDLITKEELNQLFESALNTPLQITIPSSENEESSSSHHSHSHFHSHLSPIPPSNSHIRPHTIDGSGGGGNDLKSLAEKFQRSITLQIQQNANNFVTQHDLQASLQSSYSHFENEIQKHKQEISSLSPLSGRSPTSPSPLLSASLSQAENETNIQVLTNKTEDLEKSLITLHQLVNNLDVTLKKHISSAFLKEKQLENSYHNNSQNEGWKPELEKVNENIMKSMADHKELAKALLVDLQQLQQDILNRVDEQRLTALLQEIDEKIQQHIIEGVDPVNNSLAAVIKAVKNKADRREMERLVLERITHTEETIKKLEEQQLEHEIHSMRDCAGGVKCLSCGSVGKGFHVIHPTLDPHYDLSNEKKVDGDYQQLLAVLNRQAGLKPLSRQMKPLVPVTPITRPVSTSVVSSPILKKGQGPNGGGNQEPLYRRAKAASMMKEIPKIPMISFGPSSGHPTDVYHFDQEESSTSPHPNHTSSSSHPTLSPSPSTSSASSSLTNSRIRLPRVPPSVRSSGGY